MLIYPKTQKATPEYLKSRPRSWEDKAIAWMIELCGSYDTPFHIVHVSSSNSLTAIAEAKKQGLPLSAETCPHYILFDAESIPDANTLYKCAPPIREQENNEQLKQAFLSGTLDFLASDHSPAPPILKELESGNLANAWGGIAGLQFLLRASWTSLRSMMDLQTFIPLLTSKPAQFLNIDHRKGHIKKGYDADLLIWNPESSHIVKLEEIQHKHKMNPYLGKQLYGEIKRTYVNGICVFEENNINPKRAGKWLLKEK